LLPEEASAMTQITKQFIEEEHDGSLIPAFLPLEEIGW